MFLGGVRKDGDIFRSRERRVTSFKALTLFANGSSPMDYLVSMKWSSSFNDLNPPFPLVTIGTVSDMTAVRGVIVSGAISTFFVDFSG